ncbi:MAG: hypothetical protein JHC26_09860 [Thermofilum sp.]|jgi:hypothetical protein|uniref:hypothetical protein n=1 Tax=Thermofilum sp. TaxID=1961369 RepID=UPI002583A540|nr:hypothetical protein [Thermofilum sp.]MCI4408416.1 hypothetical protein [Thermofilum sp.]MCI4409387.1 hypothetical protein [Thermofilum sp.]
MPRQKNWEIRKAIIHYYALGYKKPRELTRKLKEEGFDVTYGFVRKLLWELRKEGLMNSQARDLWNDLEAWIRSIKIHASACREHILAKDMKNALMELDKITEFATRAQKDYELLRLGYKGGDK